MQLSEVSRRASSNASTDRRGNNVTEIRRNDHDPPQQIVFSKIQNNVTHPSDCSGLFLKKINQIRFTRYDLILLVLNILMLTILIVVPTTLGRSQPVDTAYVEEILLVKQGDPFGGPGGEQLFDDAVTATLTFQDRITRVTAAQSRDMDGRLTLLSMTFRYSNGKQGINYGGIDPDHSREELVPLELIDGENIDEVTIYQDYRRIVNPWQPNATYIVVGIQFKTNRDQQILFGSSNGTRKFEAPDGYFLGYVQGKAGGYIDSLRFMWYKYTLKTSSIVSSTTSIARVQ